MTPRLLWRHWCRQDLWEPRGAEAGGPEPVCTHRLSSGRRPPALGGRELASWGSRVLHSGSSGRTWGRGVGQTPPPIPGPLVPPPRSPPHGQHASIGRRPREEGPRLRHLCPEHGAKSVVSKRTRFRVPTDLRGVSPKGSRRWQEPGQGKTWPRLQAPVHRWCGARHRGVSGPGRPSFRVTLSLPQACSWPSCCITAASLAFSRGTCSTVRRASTGSPEGGLSRGLEAARRLKRGAENGGPGSGGQGGSH